MNELNKISALTIDISFELLKLLSKGGLLPFRLLFRQLKEQYPGLESKQLRNRLYYYQNRGLISGTAVDGYTLAEKGLQKLNMLQLSHLRQEAEWDKMWRVIAFDIPETKREARDAVRRLIKQLGCHQLQRSLWIHPLPCLEQFRKIQKAYNTESDIVLFEVKWIDNEEQLLQKFQKIYPRLT